MGSAKIKKPGDQSKLVGQDFGRRLYVSNLSYQDQMRKTTQKHLDDDSLYVQSEFKKPYLESNYPEMEHFAYPTPIPFGYAGQEMPFPQTPDQGYKSDCEVSGTGMGGGYSECSPSDNCGVWEFACAHKIKKFGAQNGYIKSIKYGPNDTVQVVFCSIRDDTRITALEKDGKQYIQDTARTCLGTDPNPNCATCEDCKATYLSIGYTSQQMSVNGTQTLSVNLKGGGGPYTWSITAGGGSLSASSGTSVVYTAPSTNAECANNPTIQLQDYCGNKVTLKIAVNAYNVYEWKVAWQNNFLSTVVAYFCECAGPYWFCGSYICYYYNWKVLTEANYGCTDGYLSGGTACGGNQPTGCYFNPGCGNACPDLSGCSCNAYASICDPPRTCGITDKRTAAMKTGGCCPAGLL